MRAARLGDDAARAFAAAGDLARAQRHVETTSLHVLVTLLGPEFRPLWGGLLNSEVVRVELAARAAAAIAELPAIGGYRDPAATIPLSSELQVLLRSFKPGLVFAPAVEINELLHALLALESIAPLVNQARLDLDHLDLAIEDATRLAIRSGHAHVRAEHVLAVLARQQWFAQLVGRIAGDLERVRTAIVAALVNEHVFDLKGHQIFPNPELELLIAHASMYARVQRRPLASDLFLLRAVYDVRVQELFAAAGISHFALIHALTGDEDETPMQIVFHDDNRTSAAFVLECLQSALGHSDTDARQLAAEIEKNGHAVAGMLPRADAHLLAQGIMGRARDAGFPLLVTLQLARR